MNAQVDHALSHLPTVFDGVDVAGIVDVVFLFSVHVVQQYTNECTEDTLGKQQTEQILQCLFVQVVAVAAAAAAGVGQDHVRQLPCDLVGSGGIGVSGIKNNQEQATTENKQQPTTATNNNNNQQQPTTTTNNN